ncbi:MAG: bifunctional aspartate kinase/diaminopimelate decarboxylase [Pseudoxanthomonas suwonensis]|nr:bifunctional aspartate kinase/diaminopimelate decarboxylase [Pseudoxanthomonas suwonensis]
MSQHVQVDAPRWTVLKFGGSSVSSRERWDNIGRIAAERAGEGRVLVVVSALSGVTNELQAIAGGVADARERVAGLVQRHCVFCTELGLLAEEVIGERLQVLRGLLDDPRANVRSLDWQAEVLAQGELLSSTLGAAYLRSRGLDFGWCDARDWLLARMLPNQSAWARRLSVSCHERSDADWRERFDAQPAPMLLTQGFIAAHPDGGSAVLGRGGSDTSAAYFGALLDARQVEIWTDVPGMFSADPREVPQARLLSRLDYAEAQEITTTGAKVLHPRSIAPCRDARVPIVIMDTAHPELAGTRIDREGQMVPGVKAVSQRNGIVLVSMESTGMWQQVGFLADVFELFKKHGLSVDLIGSSETNVTVSLDPGCTLVDGDVIASLSEDLSQVCGLKVIAPCAAITLVGLGMRSLLHRLSDIWDTFGRERVHLISQSSNDLNLTFVVDEAQAHGMIPKLHAALIAGGAMPVEDERVFGPSWTDLQGTASMRPPRWWENERQRRNLLERAALGTPAYAYHLPTVRARARSLKAVGGVDRCFYAVKANSHTEILRALVAEGFGLECVSQAELEHVFTAVPGLPPEQVLFTPSFAPIGEYRAALQRGVTTTLDNVEILERWPETFAGHRGWLRLDLGRGEGHHDKVKTGGKRSKFGLPLDRLEAFMASARRVGFVVDGLHCHLGSGVDSPAHWRQVLLELCGIAQSLGGIRSLDIGGGLPVPYRAEDAPFDVAAWEASLVAVREQYPDFELVIEPGRYLVAESGVLLARATQVVDKQGVRRVGLDVGMNALLRPTLYDAWHDVVNLDRGHGEAAEDDATGLFDVVGPICESGDVFGRSRRLPADTAPDDVMLLADAGAYGMSMANTYNLRPLPREDVLDD